MERVRVVVTGEIEAVGLAMTGRMAAVAGMFGLTSDEATERRSDEGGGIREGGYLWREPVVMEIGAGDVVWIGGASGAGKSTLLRRVARVLEGLGDRGKGIDVGEKDQKRWSVVRLEEIGLERDKAVVDCFDWALEETLAVLARAGLAEARLWLLPPAALSEGQRFRYRLARFMAGARRAEMPASPGLPSGAPSGGLEVLIADEFCAALDEVTAKVVAWNLGKFVRGSAGTDRPRAAILAGTREDVVADLRPSMRVWMGLGDCVCGGLSHRVIETLNH